MTLKEVNEITLNGSEFGDGNKEIPEAFRLPNGTGEDIPLTPLGKSKEVMDSTFAITEKIMGQLVINENQLPLC